MKKSLLTAAALFLTAVPSLHAQIPSVIGAGTRVKLVSPAIESSQQIGRVVDATRDTISFRAESYPVTRTYAVNDLTSIEVSRGKPTPRRRYAIYGFAIGGVVGLAAGYHETGGGGGQFLAGGKRSAIGNALLSSAALGTLGGLAGWLYGGSHSSEKWVPAR